MLVLGREVSQRIFVGPDIVVMLVKAESGRARIGIEAPAGVAILREEIAGGQAARGKHSAAVNPPDGK